MIIKAIDTLGGLLLGRETYRRWHYKLAKRLAERQGFEVYKKQMIWQTDPEFVEARDKAKLRGIQGIPNDRSYTLLALARLVREIEGNFAECGSRYGKSSLFLLSGAGPQSAKRLHVFDSFEGLSDPGQDDIQTSGKSEWSKGDLAVPEDIVRRNLSEFGDRVVLHKGWIPERFGDVEDEEFSLVHIDVDLYEPTLAAVAFFYPKVKPGGVILCDDYGSADCPGAKKAIDEFFSDKPEKILSMTSGQSLVIKS
ncbi:TylF/MycF/NovP-related O-methyltransferase [Roseovarius sp.]|uniref:TylF/MycF/NovP-related O-methyltransferase n=1 Tax=Roseovarius sp. TaxID=1486281 RepID=UPI003A981C52